MRREHDMDPNHRRRLKPELAAEMYAYYQQVKSVEKVGLKYGRTRQCVFGIFQTFGFKCNPKEFLPVTKYRGMKFTAQKTCGRHRYLRETVRRKGTLYLHHLIWEEHYGPVPPGYKLVFKDGDHTNCDIANLECMTVSDQVKRGATGANQFTKTAAARLDLLMNNFQSGKQTKSAALKK